MADCGASGSALDRAARTVVSAAAGGEQMSAAAKVASSFIVGTTASASIASPMTLMPRAAPDRILISAPHRRPDEKVRSTSHDFPLETAWAESSERPPREAPLMDPAPASSMASATAPRQQSPVVTMMPSQMLSNGHHQNYVPEEMVGLHQHQHQNIIMQQQHRAMMMQQMHMQHEQMAHMSRMSAAIYHQQKQLDIIHAGQQISQQNHEEDHPKEHKENLKQEQSGTCASLDKAWKESKGIVAPSVDDVAASAQEQEVREITVEGDQTLNTWHHGLEEEWLDQQVQLDDSHYHEGLAPGASIEDLAAAWSAAEAESTLEAYGLEQSVQPVSYELGEEARKLAGRTTATMADSSTSSAASDLMKEGMERFEEGNICRAITCFEAELHLRNDNAVAWTMLGRCHAENDEDRKAISCLELATEHDPYDLDALLALGVSYVNELDSARALSNLRAWVEHNPKFAGLDVKDDGHGDGTVIDEVQNLLLQALDYNPNDADVLEAMGVCYNVSQDYDAAVVSLKNALVSRPDDYALWNKLGATLANNGRSEDALPSYHRAIELKPKYARAWLNMAISHSNLQNYEEAARCYLQTLSLNPSAVHCWSYLRIALTCMEKWDLLPLASSQDLASFHEHFDFVEY